MDFSEALKLLKEGAIIKREGWNRNKSIMLIQGFPSDCILPYIAISTKDNKIGVYTATNCDLLANDWVLICQDEDIELCR